MSRSAEILLEFPDEERLFRLGIGELRVLQEKTGRGPKALLKRLTTDEWFVDDLIQVILLGLIGGGMKTDLANTLVKELVIEKPLEPSVPFAQLILLAALVGSVKGDEFDEADSGGSGGMKTATGGSPSPSSTDREPPSSTGTPGPSIG